MESITISHRADGGTVQTKNTENKRHTQHTSGALNMQNYASTYTTRIWGANAMAKLVGPAGSGLVAFWRRQGWNNLTPNMGGGVGGAPMRRRLSTEGGEVGRREQQVASSQVGRIYWNL